MVSKQKKIERKTAKRKKRNQKEAIHKRRVERRARRRGRYPKFEIHRGQADPGFIDAVKEAACRVDFDNDERFERGDRITLRILAESGVACAAQFLREVSAQKVAAGEQTARYLAAQVFVNIGERIFELIPEELRRKYLPHNEMYVRCAGNAIVLEFGSLLKTPGPHGMIYYSRRLPTVTIDGRERIVAFSKHAIERLCDRLNPRWMAYAAASDVHSVFAHCKRYDPVTLYPDQPAFSLFDCCFNKGFVQYDTYVKGVMGEDNYDPSRGKAYYRVGYCPVAFEGDFAKAVTFLYPGFRGTPEYGAILNSSLCASDKVRFKQKACVNDSTNVMGNQEVDLIRWFHEQGIPQVIQSSEDLFGLS